MEIDLLDSKYNMLQTNLTKKIEFLEQKIIRKRLKKKSRKSEISDLKNKLHNITSDNTKLARDLKGLQQKLDYTLKSYNTRSFSNKNSLSSSNFGFEEDFGDLENFRKATQDLRDQITDIASSIKAGFEERTKKLSESLLFKDDEVFNLMTENEQQIREIKREYKKKITDFREAHSSEISELQIQLQEEIEKNISLNSQICNFEAIKFESTINKDKLLSTERVCSLLEKNAAAKEAFLATKDSKIKLESKVIIDFMAKIQLQVTKIKSLEHKLNLFKDWKRQMKVDRQRLFFMIKQILTKFVLKKKTTEIEAAFNKLSDFDRGDTIKVFSELGINPNKYIS